MDQKFDEIADSEIGRIALSIIPEFLPGLKGAHRRSRKVLGLVSLPYHDRLNEPFMFKLSAPEQHCREGALRARERPFDRSRCVGDFPFREPKLTRKTFLLLCKERLYRCIRRDAFMCQFQSVPSSCETIQTASRLASMHGIVPFIYG